MAWLIWICLLLGVNVVLPCLSLWPMWLWKKPWSRAVSAAILFPLVALFTFLFGNHLPNSYHCDDITGNPAYSSGRFWHTPFTGQYPRDPNRRPTG